MAIDSDTVWGTAARVATARGADECDAGECGADERGAGKSDAGCDGVGCNVAGRKSTAPDVRCDTSRHEAGRHATQVEHEMLPNLMLASPILLDTWILSLVPTTSMVESVGLASVVPGSAVPETCSVMGRHVGAGAQAWEDG